MPVGSILELFGAIDAAVEASENPELAAAADALMPGAAANAGWYQTLRAYLAPDANLPAEPNADKALADIGARTAAGRNLTRQQKARLLFGISAAARLKRVAPGCSLPSFGDPASAESLHAGLCAIAPSERTLEERRTAAERTGREFLAHTADNFVSQRDFDSVVRPQALATIRLNKPLAAPLCKSALVTVDGIDSVLVDTKFDITNRTLAGVMGIVNPFNWDEDYREFFLDMTEQTPNRTADGWRRVLEKVRLIEGFDLTTPLKFYPHQSTGVPSEASIDYDLDTAALETGDGRVRVDKGYIRLKAIPATGSNPDRVRVVTRKVVHIDGLIPWVQARLVCICGYGTSSADFLINGVENPPPSPEPFFFPENVTQRDDDTDPGASPQTAHCVPAAVDVWAATMGDLTTSYANLAEKWLAGGLTLTDLADQYRTVGGQLAAAPWDYLRAMTTRRAPGGQDGPR